MSNVGNRNIITSRISFIVMFLLFSNSMYAQKTIKVLTHNVLAFSGHPKDIHTIDTAIFRRAIVFYKSLNADILVLQECPPEDFIRAMASELRYHYVFFKAKFSGNQQYPYGFPGAILTRFPITSKFDLNEASRGVPDSIFQRHLGAAVIKIPKGYLQITALHLCADWGGVFRETTRLEELELAKTIWNCDSCQMQLLVGDFNSQPNSSPYQKILENHFEDTHKIENEPTVPIPNSKVRIDYIFVRSSKNYRYKALPITTPFYDDLQLNLTDHQPVLTEFFRKKK